MNLLDPLQLKIQPEYAAILKYDSLQEGKNIEENGRILIFATNEGIDQLKEIRIWSIDGTFSSSPKPFKQILTSKI